jgi:agarase
MPVTSLAGEEGPGGPVAVRGRPGWFRLERGAGGRWRLFDPAGERVFLRGVHHVEPSPPPGDGPLPPDAAARLRGWGFNALGLGAEAIRADGFPHLAAVDFCRAGPVLTGPGLRLPDVFDLAWPSRAVARAAEVCGPGAGETELVGWVTDADLAWAQVPGSGRPTLLQLCLAQEPSAAAYHAAWEFVLALHGGRLEGVARAWGQDWAHRERVRELTRAEKGIATRGYLRDAERWTREFARRYFTAAAAAIRAADPNHLILGCPLGEGAGPEVAAECAYPAVDLPLIGWRAAPPLDSAHPFLADGVGWSTPEFRAAGPGGGRDRATGVERMLRRARAALDRLAAHPAAVGYCWRRWQDEPAERPPFGSGLLHHDGSEAPEHLELIAAFNARLARAERER